MATSILGRAAGLVPDKFLVAISGAYVKVDSNQPLTGILVSLPSAGCLLLCYAPVFATEAGRSCRHQRRRLVPGARSWLQANLGTKRGV